MRIVLVEPENPRNVGAVVRVAANFALPVVSVVRGDGFSAEETRELTVASSGAMARVSLQVVPTVEEALEGVELVLGTSGRMQPGDEPTGAGLADFIEEQRTGVAVVFGRESSGLRTQELNLCHGIIRLQVAPEFPSLNLSHAVAILADEWVRLSTRGAERKISTAQGAGEATASRDLQERFITKLALTDAQAAQLRRLLQRASPSEGDMALLMNLAKRATRK